MVIQITRLHPQGKGGPKVPLCWISLTIRCNLLFSLYRKSIPESAKFCSESTQLNQKSPNFVHLFDQFVQEIYSWIRQKLDLKVFSWTHAKIVSWEPGRRNRVKCLTPRLWARTDRQTHRQTDEHIIFEAHYTMGPSGNNIFQLAEKSEIKINYQTYERVQS